jgi:NAD(P)-dependent dehydrogenase (short-subunit alcohol dehydrogenase family)
MTLLSDRVVVVTGSARGIGRAIAERCAEEGAAVGVVDILGDEAEATAAAITNGGGRAMAVQVDVTRADSVAAMAAAVAIRFGAIDVLVNNAGLLRVARRPFDEIPEEEWDLMMAVNVKGMWLCCRSIVPFIRQRGGGSIVNIASDVILSGVPGLVHYSSSKGAVFAFTRAMARELGADNIRVNAIAPGFTVTDAAMEHGHDAAERRVQARALQRAERPEDLAGTVVYLASGLSDFVTGQLIAVNGGYVLH